jgi:hypothetical protein
MNYVEAMKQALEALEAITIKGRVPPTGIAFSKAKAALAACEQTLAAPVQPEQEPCGWQFYQNDRWNNGMETNNHRENTEDAGIPTRNVYPAAQPAQQEPVASKPDWQTIETAPKGYTAVLVWNGQHVGEARYIPEQDADEFGWWWANTDPGNYDESRIDRQPTHWMPMPAAPIEAAHNIKE